MVSHYEAVDLIDIDRLANAVGGRFALTALVAKRLRAINGGAPVLVESRPGERLIETVCREIKDGKVWLEKATEVARVEEEQDDYAELLDLD